MTTHSDGRVTHCHPVHADSRGHITDIVTAADGFDFDSATIIISYRGSRRGDHYHKETTQMLYLLSGQLRVLTTKPNLGTVRQDVLFPGDSIIHSPMDAHAVIAVEDSQFLILTRGPRSGSSYESDTFRLPRPLVSPIW